MTTAEKIISLYPKKRVRQISLELKTSIGYVKDVLYKYGMIETKVRFNGYRYGERKRVKYPEPERERIERAAW